MAVASAAHGADIGGWMQQQQRTELSTDDCAALIVQAARTPREAADAAQSYYASGLCYLYSDKVGRDPVAADAWLARAAELEHPQARRTLLEMRQSVPSSHAAGPHCHDLGQGRKLCHGGAASQ
jgi:TPR repeat protein